MKSTIILSLILLSLLVSGNIRAADQTLTIYFSGTTMNSGMWQPALSPFRRAETVASLHHFQKVGADNPNHHKGIVNGIRLFDAPNPSIADALGGRGWNAILREAVSIAESVLNSCTGECITLNLVGFSRGAVSTMHMAHQLSTNPAYEYIKSRLKTINILAFDPVPGDAIMSSAMFNLPSNVNYLGFYSVDERSSVFAPVFPNPSLAGDPMVAFYTVPGSHETMVGNTLSSGHRTGVHDSARLEHVSRALKIIATEMLGSSDWGHVRFMPDSDPELNLDWYSGETDLTVLRQTLVNKLEAMYVSPYPANYYWGMHNFGFAFFLESWNDSIKFCELAITLFGRQHHPRCAYSHSYLFYPNGYTGALGLANWAIVDVEFSVPAPQLRARSFKEYDIWNLIRQRGSLDVDADFVDYSDDNCPVSANPNQVDTDADAIGDVCDADDDNDGVADESDLLTKHMNRILFIQDMP